ncbi:MAG TPA: hypothetical protein VMF58_08395 [Rhizomicrobium sp.]|nr:hypothetical protein [Rhizomicrobium sp.]
MFYRPSPIALCLAAIATLVWNAWFKEQSIGDAVVGDAFGAIYLSVAAFVAVMFVIFFPGYRPTDRYWAYATLGMIIGFWTQR